MLQLQTYLPSSIALFLSEGKKLIVAFLVRFTVCFKVNIFIKKKY